MAGVGVSGNSAITIYDAQGTPIATVDPVTRIRTTLRRVEGPSEKAHQERVEEHARFAADAIKMASKLAETDDPDHPMFHVAHILTHALLCQTQRAVRIAAATGYDLDLVAVCCQRLVDNGIWDGLGHWYVEHDWFSEDPTEQRGADMEMVLFMMTAAGIVERTPAVEPERLPAGLRESAQKNPDAVALGRLGGLKGGPARAARMTPKERAESGRKAARARWDRSARIQEAMGC